MTTLGNGAAWPCRCPRRLARQRPMHSSIPVGRWNSPSPPFAIQLHAAIDAYRLACRCLRRRRHRHARAACCTEALVAVLGIDGRRTRVDPVLFGTRALHPGRAPGRAPGSAPCGLATCSDSPAHRSLRRSRLSSSLLHRSATLRRATDPLAQFEAAVLHWHMQLAVSEWPEWQGRYGAAATVERRAARSLTWSEASWSAGSSGCPIAAAQCARTGDGGACACWVATVAGDHGHLGSLVASRHQPNAPLGQERRLYCIFCWLYASSV